MKHASVIPLAVHPETSRATLGKGGRIMRAGWLEIALAAALAFGCSRVTEADGGATPEEDGGGGTGTAPEAGSEEQAFSLHLLSDSGLKASDLDQQDMAFLELRAEPLLTESDISYYNWRRHAFSLLKESTITFPEPGVFGIPFVVVSQGQRQYLGAFWTMISSLASGEPAIVVDSVPGARTYIMEPSYPGGSPGSGSDPRENPAIKEALKKAGKLVDVQLPSSMKGYEIYSWNGGEQDWWFTLIAGTNRNKSCDEVVVDEDVVDAGSVVNTVSHGVDAFNATLSRLPAGETILWWQTLPECDLLAVPGPEIVEEIRIHCTALALDLQGPGV
jgi:hypothetical protein